MLQSYNEKFKHQTFFHFLRFAMNPNTQPPPNVKELDWNHLFAFATEQAIAGVIFEGVSRLGEQGVKCPFNILMKWIAYWGQIESKNRLLNRKCTEVINEYRAASFDCCILKGQGNALMYPNAYSRTPGDIDLLIRNADRKQLLRYLAEKKKVQDSHYQHIEYEDGGVLVEIHLMPTYANNPIYHQRLQKWLESHSDCIWENWKDLPDGAGRITVPQTEYNIIFQLSHMQGHFFDEGIGLRQLMDYFYLMKNEKCRMKNLQFGETNLPDVLEHLGLRKFAGAVMYVLQEVFGLEDEYLIVPVDEWRGKTLLEEILRGGNFGHYSGLTEHGAATKYFLKIKRNMHFVHQYPAEALCEPLFRTWHFFWRLFHS